MLRAGAIVQRRFRWSVLGLGTLLAFAAVATTADARGRHHRHHRATAAERYQPSYASIVVDANSGAVLQATNADSPRHPASLTKIMTLYLLFERLEAGKIKMSTEMEVSPHAAAQAPSKLGLKPGQTIAVETAIRAIVTKSANDVAVVIAEALGGTEDNFAKLMTAKARALGMTHTVYRDASGLPNDDQITTARDMTILARAIQDRFPQYYHYFGTRTFAYHGKEMRNHNHLLGRVPGVDGMKTGYIHDSGFNIVLSMRRGSRHILAVVFGGRTASERDARALSLMDNTIRIASDKRTAPPIVEGHEVAEARAKDSTGIKDVKVALVIPSPHRAAPALGSTDPIKANPVKTFTVQVSAMRTASVPFDGHSFAPEASPSKVTNVILKREPSQPPEEKQAAPAALPAKVASAGDSLPVEAAMPEPAAKPHSGGWMIQVGAFPEEKEAKQRLVAAQDKAKALLGRADPFTEKVEKGDRSLYRARFAGLNKDQAETACKHLKRSEIPCMLLRN
jgi:D-alanyl-D-alanine carboxypeptidase